MCWPVWPTWLFRPHRIFKRSVGGSVSLFIFFVIFIVLFPMGFKWAQQPLHADPRVKKYNDSLKNWDTQYVSVWDQSALSFEANLTFVIPPCLQENCSATRRNTSLDDQTFVLPLMLHRQVQGAVEGPGMNDTLQPPAGAGNADARAQNTYHVSTDHWEWADSALINPAWNGLAAPNTSVFRVTAEVDLHTVPWVNISGMLTIWQTNNTEKTKFSLPVTWTREQLLHVTNWKQCRWNAHGVWSNGKCKTYTITSGLCLIAEYSASDNLWHFDANTPNATLGYPFPSGSGCVPAPYLGPDATWRGWSNWHPKKTSDGSLGTNLRHVNIAVRNAHDPWLVFLNVSKGADTLGFMQKDIRIIGIAFEIVGAVALCVCVVLCCCCCWEVGVFEHHPPSLSILQEPPPKESHFSTTMGRWRGYEEKWKAIFREMQKQRPAAPRRGVRASRYFSRSSRRESGAQSVPEVPPD
eukprot:TRINITY_DN75099_c0_g1_i1.p1 TRINITY_DN75099_c0_g1~~TRINITY_DN75099_c0_g1_i1.p1  ORF type:complete len:466 (+),score=21.26 TRINITY_DN75099_c0_g1_i1:45-1442(+)